MTTVSATTIPRMYHNELEHALECLYCFDAQEIPRHKYRDPQSFAEFRELTELDHSECCQYASVEEAQKARKWRKAVKRAQILENKRREGQLMFRR